MANNPMKKIYVAGGQFRRSVFQKLEEWESCKQAMVAEIDPVSKTSRTCVEYESPKEAAADELPASCSKPQRCATTSFTSAPLLKS